MAKASGETDAAETSFVSCNAQGGVNQFPKEFTEKILESADEEQVISVEFPREECSLLGDPKSFAEEREEEPDDKSPRAISMGKVIGYIASSAAAGAKMATRKAKGVSKHAGPAVKTVAGAAGGAVVGGATVSAGVPLTLNVLGFTALGPAAGSYAAGWMSSIAVANGGGVAAGSWYAAAQAAAMGGPALVAGAPVVAAAGAVVAAGVAWKYWA